MSQETRKIVPILIFLALLFGVIVASYFPHARLWGLNHWRYFPLTIRLAGVGLIALCGIWISFGRVRPTLPWNISKPRAELWTLGAGCALLISFVLFRNQTHFLGDGYQLLATLPSDQPYLKSRNFGGMMLPYLLMHLLGGATKANALLSYQIVSYVCGAGFLVLAYLFARINTEHPKDRALLWLGIVSGGYMLLFFGYVENYATVLVSVLCFCIVGLLVEQNSLSRWWLLPAYLLTIFFHVFGLSLLPSVIYLFIKVSPQRSILRAPLVQRAVWIGGFAVAVATFIYLAASNYFFRFAFISAVPTRFTVAGYTALSASHLLDFANLLSMLLPGLFLTFTLVVKIWRSIREDACGLRFLLLTASCLFGLAFIVDPGLGMPRDWDLFAAAGVPLAAFLFVALTRRSDVTSRLVAVLSILLNLSILIPRVAVSATPDHGLQQAEDYVMLDSHKCLTYSYVVVDYVRDHHSVDSALSLQTTWEPLFPDDRQLDTGLVLLSDGRYADARSHFQKATVYNAMNYSAWANLGRTFLETERYDSAIATLRIAAGINPYSTTIANNLAWAYYFGGNQDAAEQCWIKSRKLDTANVIALTGLATLYQARNDQWKYLIYFDSIVHRHDIPDEYLLPAAEYHAAQGDLLDAKGLVQRARQNGLDSLAIGELLRKYPNLRD